ncbi:hypothetical protein [Actinosynnema mirum]|uniref:Uncharacterized protein n=1 Tax=Actinosynnema mirum (strain ATCC 29888 / DSM 43827 / JCM 3225 / NBRC 14064 / NCIMB 13271 / NRRL B-12336 / IMRU 3971 / 101) TaxID=446462 RepID=C6WBX5_ACTMD|nr:hypothetical protein [Actinosynnema mirum]ACU37542.1 hypothetical protein Amir_3657 [Actinosynnema mirum DSM 43827]
MDSPTDSVDEARSSSYTAEEFVELVRDVAADEMPRLFAIVYEQVPCRDAEVAAYGMAFQGRAELVNPDGTERMTSASADQAVAVLAAGTGDNQVRAHVVWLDAKPA